MIKEWCSEVAEGLALRARAAKKIYKRKLKRKVKGRGTHGHNEEKVQILLGSNL